MTDAAQRIHVIGVSGTGKSTLGRRLGVDLRIPVYHLDDIARSGGGRGIQRPLREREAAITEIVAKASWITEGIHIGWTDPLLVHAQLIIWLDNVSPGVAQARLVRRFVSQALAEAKRRQGRDRFLRVGDYARELRALLVHLRTVGRQSRAVQPDETETEARTAIERALGPYMDRVIRCADESAVEAVVQYLRAAAPADSHGDREG